MTYSLLNRLSIVEGAAFVAAPLAGTTLAALGADVIRFDPVGGGVDYGRWPLSRRTGRSLYWAGLNQGKRSIAVDLRSPQGRELIHALIARPGDDAGILLSNFAGVAWLEHAALRKHRDDVIKVEIRGNRDGSSAVDYTVNCAAGYPAVTGGGSLERPVNHVLPAWDVATGLQAVVGALAALEHRRRTGEGQLVSLALSDVAFSVVGHLGHIAEAELDDAERESIGNDLYGAFGRDFATADGRRVMLVAITVRQWRALCRASGLGDAMAALERELGADFEHEGDRYREREVIGALLARWCREKSLDELRAVLDREGVCWGVYQSFRQLVADDPRVSEDNPVFQKLRQPGLGEYLAPGSPLDFGRLARGELRPAPLLGQHTEEILAGDLGLDAGEIGRLHDAGVVAGAQAAS